MIDFIKASDSDIDFLYSLRNESQSRRYSKRGFLDKYQIEQDYLNNTNKQTFIARVDKNNIGYIIFEELEKDVYEISVAVIAAQRGRGIGKKLVREANKFAVDSIDAKKIVAEIYPENKSSIKIFEANSYILIDSEYKPWKFQYIPSKNEKKQVFVFDFDGVIVDSINALSEAYLQFLSSYGFEGNKVEFNTLNGPSLKEIISILKRKYNLKPKHEELYNQYNDKIEKAYDDIKLIDGVEEALKYLINKGYGIALASSSKEKFIVDILKKYKIYDYFQEIVSQDDVENGKPSPDIYNNIRKRFQGCEFYVIEDSENGIKAAHNANMVTIHFNPDKQNINENPNYLIRHFRELKHIIEDIEFDAVTVAEAKEVTIKYLSYKPRISDDEQKKIEYVWEQADKTSGLFNGQILYYKSHNIENDKLNIECFSWEYKLFFAQQQTALSCFHPIIAVSGVIIDAEQNTLIAKRQNVTEYDGYYELVPSGSISISKVKDDSVDFQSQIEEEFEEETSLDKKLIERIEPICLIYDKNHGTYDIGIIILIKGRLIDLIKKMNSDEYSNYEIIPISEFERSLQEHNFIPTSIQLAKELIKIKNPDQGRGSK